MEDLVAHHDNVWGPTRGPRVHARSVEIICISMREEMLVQLNVNF